jgi:hypothetical protein
MRYSSHMPRRVGRLGQSIARTAEAVLFAIIVDPFALVAAALFVWLLAHTLAGVWHFHANGFGLCEVLSCGACITALCFLILLAVGHFVLTILAVRLSDR